MTSVLAGKKRWLLISGVAALVMASAAVLWLSRPESKSAYLGTSEKIVIGNIGEYSIFDLIAQEKGFFVDSGLDAQIIRHDAGPAAMADLLSGKVDVIVAADFVGVRNMFANPDIRVISQASKHQVFQVVARRDHDIYAPRDLKGKKVGVTKRSAGEFYLGRFLEFENLTMQDVRAVDLPPAEIIRQIESGELDAAVIFDPHAYDLKKKLGNAVIIWSAHREQKTFALVYGMRSYIEAHPEIVERYLRAIIAAEEFTKKHPEEAKNILAALLHYESEYIDYMWENFTFTHGLDQGLLLSMETQALWLIENGLTEERSVPNYLKYVYFDGLDAVRPDKITIFR